MLSDEPGSRLIPGRESQSVPEHQAIPSAVMDALVRYPLVLQRRLRDSWPKVELGLSRVLTKTVQRWVCARPIEGYIP